MNNNELTQNENTETRTAISGKRNMSRLSKSIVLLAALIGAFLVWVYAIGYDNTQYEEKFNDIEVYVTGTRELEQERKYTLAEWVKIDPIDIVVKGRKSEIKQYQSSDFHAVVDISVAVSPGKQPFTILVKAPSGVEIVWQSTSYVDLMVDEFTRDEYEIVPEIISGVFADGAELTSLTADPVRVSVSGPRTELDNIAKVCVQISREGKDPIDDSFTEVVPILLFDKDNKLIDNQYVSLSKNEAKVTATVTHTKAIPVRVEFNGGAFDVDSAVSVEPSITELKISGSRSAVAAINELVLYIDERTITGASGKKKFDFIISEWLPESVSNESGSETLTVEVTIPKMRSRVYTVRPEQIVVEGLTEGNGISIVTDFSVNVMGPGDAFVGFSESMITAVINFDSLTVNEDGSYSAVPNVTVDKDGLYIAGEIPVVTFYVVTPDGMPDKDA